MVIPAEKPTTEKEVTAKGFTTASPVKENTEQTTPGNEENTEGTTGTGGKSGDKSTAGPTDEPGTHKQKTLPKTGEPASEQPGTEQPGTEEPGSQKPGTQKPGTQKPETKNPNTDAPGSEQPGTEETETVEPATEKPRTQKPATQKPVTQKPETQKPGTQKPETQKPGTQKPSNTEQTFSFEGTEPSTDKTSAETDQPKTDGPETNGPETDGPETTVAEGTFAETREPDCVGPSCAGTVKVPLVLSTSLRTTTTPTPKKCGCIDDIEDTPINPDLKTSCDQDMDIMLFFDSSSADYQFKYQFYDHFTSVFDNSEYSRHYRFATWNGEKSKSDFYEHSNDKNKVLTKLAISKPTDNPIAVIQEIKDSAVKMFQPENGVRSNSTKVIVAVIHEWRLVGNVFENQKVIKTLFKQFLNDYGIYVHFVLVPKQWNVLKQFKQVLVRENFEYTFMAPMSQFFSNIDEITGKLCKSPLPPLQTTCDHNCHELLEEYKDYDDSKLYEKSVQQNFYENVTPNKCGAKDLFRLTIITDSSYSLRPVGFAYQKTFLRKLLLSLPQCAKYSIIRLNGPDSVGYVTGKDMNGPKMVNQFEAVQSLDLNEKYESTVLRHMNYGVKETMKNAYYTGKDGVPHVTMFVMNGKAYDESTIIHENSMRQLAEQSTIVLVSSAGKIRQRSFYSHATSKHLFSSYTEMLNRTEIVAGSVFCMKKKIYTAVKEKTDVEDVKKPEIPKWAPCQKPIDIYLTIDSRSSSVVIDEAIEIAAQIMENFDLRREEHVRLFVNQARILSKKGRASHTMIGTLLKHISAKQLKMNGFGKMFGKLYMPNRRLVESTGRQLRQIIFLSSEETFEENHDEIIDQILIGGGGVSLLPSDHLDPEGPALQELSQRNLGGDDRIYKNIIWKSYENDGFSDDFSLPGNNINSDLNDGDYDNDFSTMKLVESLCIFSPDPIPEKEEENEIAEELHLPNVEKCDDPTDIAVLIDGSIPMKNRYIVVRFLKELGKIFSDIGEDGTKIAVYTATRTVRYNGEHKPELADSPYFVNKKHKKNFKNRTSVSLFDNQEELGNFDFNQATDHESFKDLINTLKLPGFKVVDVDQSIEHVLRHGFSIEKGARTDPLIPKQLIVMTWDYSTFRPVQVELARIMDISTIMLYLNNDNSVLYKRKERFGNTDLASLSKQIHSFKNMRQELLRSNILHHVRQSSHSLSSLVAPSKMLSIRDEVCQLPKNFQECKLSMDLVILLDGSASMGNKGFLKTVGFLKSLVRTFSISNDTTRVGVLQFSKDVTVELDLVPRTRVDLFKEITEIKFHQGTTTRTGKGLNQVYNLLFRNRRKNIPAVVIVITDGKSYDKVGLAAKRLKLMAMQSVKYRSKRVLC